MLKNVLIVAFATVAFLTNSVCHAGFFVKNNCDSNLEVTWVMTSGPNVYSYLRTIRPGEQFEITGGFNSNRTYWLSIRRLDNGQPITLDQDFRTQIGPVYVRSTTMHYFQSPDFTNDFVASQLRAGNWNPLKNTTQTTDALPCIRVSNGLNGESRGGEITIGNGQVFLRAW